MYRTRHLKIGLLTLIISGCSISDPQRGGLIGGLIGLYSGQYERGTEELKDEATLVKSDVGKAKDKMELSAVEVERKHRELIELRETVDRIAEKTRGFSVVPAQADDSSDIQEAKADLITRLQALNVKASELQQRALSTLANPTTTGDWEKIELLKKDMRKINEELESLRQTAEELR